MNNLKKIDFIDLENFSKEELYKILRNAQNMNLFRQAGSRRSLLVDLPTAEES